MFKKYYAILVAGLMLNVSAHANTDHLRIFNDNLERVGLNSSNLSSYTSLKSYGGEDILQLKDLRGLFRSLPDTRKLGERCPAPKTFAAFREQVVLAHKVHKRSQAIMNGKVKGLSDDDAVEQISAGVLANQLRGALVETLYEVRKGYMLPKAHEIEREKRLAAKARGSGVLSALSLAAESVALGAFVILGPPVVYGLGQMAVNGMYDLGEMAQDSVYGLGEMAQDSMGL